MALWVPRLAGPLDLRYDAGVYYILGTSLAAGQGYRLTNEPGALEAIQYPPLLPLFAAAHQRLLGTADPAVAGHALRWSYAALFVAYAVAVHALARRRLGRGWGLVATLLVVLHTQLAWLSNLFFAELPFALCTVLFLLVADRGARRGVAGLFAVATYLLRSAGIATFAAWVVDGFLRRNFREALVRGVIALLPILAWQSYVTRVQHSPDFLRPAYEYQRAPYQFYNVGYAANMSYVDPFAPELGLAGAREVLGRVAANVAHLPVAVGVSMSVDDGWPRGLLARAHERWSLPIPAGIVELSFGFLGIMAFAGQCVLLIRGERLMPLFWLASLALIVMTPWQLQFARYLVPLAPVTAVGLVTAMALAARTNRALRVAFVVGTAFMLLCQTVVLTEMFRRRHVTVADGTHRLFYYDEDWAQQDRAIAWLGAHLDPDAIVATSTPYRLYITTGVRAVMPPFETDPAEAERLLDGVPVDYLVIDDLQFTDITRRYGAPVVERFPERWTLVYGSAASGPRIYRRVRAG